MTTFTPTTYDVMEDPSCCEICGAADSYDEPFGICEGARVCEPCAVRHGDSLAQFNDAMDEELRHV